MVFSRKSVVFLSLCCALILTANTQKAEAAGATIDLSSVANAKVVAETQVPINPGKCRVAVKIGSESFGSLQAGDQVCVASLAGGSYCLAINSSTVACGDDNPPHICGTHTITQSADCADCGGGSTGACGTCCDALAPSAAANAGCRQLC